MRELHSHATDHCEGIYIRFAEICLWILIGMAISYKLCRLYDRLRSQKHEPRQQQPLLQQPQLQQEARCSSRSTGKWRKKLLVVFVLGGIITSFWLFWYLNEDIMLRRKETLASMCDERARMLQDQFNVSMNHVHALAILVSTFHHGKLPSAIDQVQMPIFPNNFLSSDYRVTSVLPLRRHVWLCCHNVIFLPTFGSYRKPLKIILREQPLKDHLQVALLML